MLAETHRRITALASWASQAAGATHVPAQQQQQPAMQQPRTASTPAGAASTSRRVLNPSSSSQMGRPETSASSSSSMRAAGAGAAGARVGSAAGSVQQVCCVVLEQCRSLLTWCRESDARIARYVAHCNCDNSSQDGVALALTVADVVLDPMWLCAALVCAPSACQGVLEVPCIFIQEPLDGNWLWKGPNQPQDMQPSKPTCVVLESLSPCRSKAASAAQCRALAAAGATAATTTSAGTHRRRAAASSSGGGSSSSKQQWQGPGQAAQQAAPADVQQALQLPYLPTGEGSALRIRIPQLCRFESLQSTADA